MKRRSTILLLATMASALVALPVFSQEAGRDNEKGIYEAVPLSTKDYHLVETSEEMHAQLVRRGMLYGDADLDAWLQSIGERVAPEPTDFYQDYRFYLLRDPSPNAFALPNGQIYVHTGMIARLENEAQLASLLAHEINHVAGHHGVLAFRSQKRKVVASIFVGIAIGVAAGNSSTGANWGQLAGTMSNLGFIWSILGYSRELEQEADLRAYDRLLAAGYDVREMPKLYDHLGKDFEGLEPRLSTKWSTHPDLIDRGIYMQARADETPQTQLDTLTLGDDSFRARVRPLALASVNDYITDDYARSALVLARQLTEEDPFDAAAWIAVGDAYAALGVRSEYVDSQDEASTDKERKQLEKDKRALAREKARMTREEWQAKLAQAPDAQANLESNLSNADSAYRTATELDSSAAEAYRGLGNTRLMSKAYREAGQAFVQYLKLRPDAPDRAIVMDELRSIAAQLKSEQETGDED